MSEDERQLAFGDLDTAVAEVETRQEQAITAASPSHRAARRNRGNLPEDLPRIERVIEPDSLYCPCGCGTTHRIGEDRTERLDLIPAQLRVIVTVRPKYACRCCAEGVTRAPATAHLIVGGLPTAGAIAHVLVASSRTNCRYTAKARASPAPESISTAARWPTASERLPSTLVLWLIGWASAGMVIGAALGAITGWYG